MTLVAYDGAGADGDWGTVDDHANGSSQLEATSCGPSACEAGWSGCFALMSVDFRSEKSRASAMVNLP